MTTLDRLIEVFQAVFEEEVDVTAVTPQASLREDIGINSIGMLYMAMALEEEFEVKFTSDEFSRIRTVQDVIDRLEEKKG